MNRSRPTGNRVLTWAMRANFYGIGSTKMGREECQPCKISGVNSGQRVSVCGSQYGYDLDDFEIGHILSAYIGGGDGIPLHGDAKVMVRCFGTDIDFSKAWDEFGPTGGRADDLPEGWVLEGFDPNESAFVFAVYGTIGVVDDDRIRELMAEAYAPGIKPVM